MRIELPNEHWVEVRENLKGRDKEAAHSAVTIVIEDGKQVTDAGVMDRMHNALLASVITAWSFPEPIPAEVGGAAAVADLDLEYHDVLVAKTAHLLKKVSFKVPN